MINVAVSGYPNEAEYNSTDKKIYFKHNDTILPSMTIDATDFIKDGMIESVEVVQSGGTSYLKIVWNLDGSSGSTKKTIHLNIGDLFEADNYYTTGQTSGATQIANALAAKQNSLVSGINIKTINNESILGEGNITIEGGGSSYTAGDGIDITNDVISVTGKVDTSAFTAHTADTVIHVTSDEKAAWNGKQDQLISGVNIKTINNKSILGEGNITIEGGKAIEAGRGISVTTSETADTVSFNLPISAGTVTNALIYNSTTNAASGDFSHAEGYYATASGEGSHAEGQGTTASGTCAHAEGNYSNASGNYSHAEGNSTITNNQSEHASGQFNVSSSVSTTFGDAGNTLFSVGNGTSSNNRKNAFEIRQNGDIYITSGGTDIKLQNHLGGGGGGTSYEAGRAIDITNNLISLDLPISAGTRTNALIYNNTTNVASGYYSNAEGFGTTANGMCSHAEGENTTASGNFSHAEGESTIAKNMSEHASGQYNVSSSASTTFGDAGNTLFSVGNGTSSNNRKNAFEIRQNGDIYITSGGTDIKLQNHLGGGGGGTSYEAGRAIDITNNLISLDLPISAGTRTNALIYNNTTNVASGYYSNAEGFGTTANGMCSHAEGENTTASGNFSHAEGESTIAKNMSEHASGQYNVSSSASTTFGDAGNTLFSVGNGISDSNRKNAFEIRQNGDTYLNGKLNITGDVTANAFYATSDERLKENIENVSYAKMANAANVNIKSFNFKSDEEKKTVIGVIAQDVENENLGFIVSTSNDGMKAVDYTGLSLLKIAYLEQKIKELENIINELKENKQ